jgi:hypothetical protein
MLGQISISAWREPDKPKIQRALGNFVDLPRDGHGLHLRGQHNAESRHLKKDKTGIGEGFAPAGYEGLWCGHRGVLCHKTKNHTRMRATGLPNGPRIVSGWQLRENC